jgi:hypothetical protein
LIGRQPPLEQYKENVEVLLVKNAEALLVFFRYF